ncbi:hypothetical protein D3C87_666150 [compost metagenome]
MIFSQFSFEFKGELSEVLKTGHNFFVSREKINKRDLNIMFGSLIVPYDEKFYLTTLNYDANGKPIDGTAIRTVGKDQYEVIVYENGKVKSTKTIKDLVQLKYEDFDDDNSLDGNN